MTLDYWNGFTGGDGPHMRTMLEAFNKEYAGRIEVRNVTRRWEDLYPAMPTAITAGKGPDVAVIHNDWIGTFATRKTLIPLDDVVGALKLSESDFIPAVWNAGIYDGKRYSVPLDVHSLADYWKRLPPGEDRPRRRPRRQGRVRGRPGQAQAGRDREPVLDARQVAGSPYVHESALAVRRRALQRGRRERALGLRGGRQGPGLDGRADRQGPQPGQGRPGQPVRRLQERQGQLHLGRHLADQ
ncbi:extracellular solute-binding protein [Streptosporangium vulgare]|uniref:extracellular solute-binding protein n=1 Tax=Streptosporangium vulgare TaxID=46190 RepID=UPI0031E007CA